MSKLSFKSVGTTKERIKDSNIEKTKLPIGIATPLSFGTESIFKMHYVLADQVHDNLKNLILTNWGERLCHYSFGANLSPLLSEFTTLDNFDDNAIQRIKNAVTKWMSYVDLDGYESSVSKLESNTVVRLKITYNVPALNVFNKSLEISFNVM